MQKFYLTVGSCCISNPSFTYSGSNPVVFTNTSTGITSHEVKNETEKFVKEVTFTN
ncbi:MAG: hypothetical protein JJ975_08480 [Bacteroidia bacterium]|nr:hypothetical protein [Bacteroidia bacterium]